MTDHSITAQLEWPIPDDDPARSLTVTASDDQGARHVSVAGSIYTILMAGEDTAGRYCLIDMLIPNGSGPPPHRHDFEEMFTLLDGELEFTFRGEERTVRAPTTVNIPANAPHTFTNRSGHTAHLLCLCAPAGQEEFFLSVGVPVPSRSASPPKLSEGEQASKAKLAEEFAPKYRTEMLKHA